jgi:hypothetical protein
MKKDLLWIAAAALLLPILARLIWFYPGVPSRPEIATPDYQSLSIPQAPIETPDSEEKVKQRGGVVLVITSIPTSSSRLKSSRSTTQSCSAAAAWKPSRMPRLWLTN